MELPDNVSPFGEFAGGGKYVSCIGPLVPSR
jgi:hypothetical protein